MNKAYTFLGLALTLVLALPTAAQAASTSLYVEQKSMNDTFGEWVVTFPGSGEFTSKIRTKVISNLNAGTHRLSVRPPANAYVHITLYENGVPKDESDLSYIDINVKDGNEYRATINYTYKGVVKVLSDPAGVEFEMVSVHGDTFQGKTPAVYTDMPAIGYRVTYGLEADCEAKKSQQRPLYAGSNLTFYANIDCGDKRIPTSGRTAKPLAHKKVEVEAPVNDVHSEYPAQRIVQTSSMSEIVAGGRTTITITVRNVTRESLNNVRVTDRFNPELIDIVTPLGQDGVINENTLEWNVEKIYAGKTWSTSFDIVAKDHVKTGDRILLLAQAESDENDFDIYPHAWSSVTGIGVAYMPETGGKYDVLFGIAALLAAGGITHVTMRKKQLLN